MIKKVAIVGYGSIGKRHFHAFSTLGCNVRVVSRRELRENFTSYKTISECISSFQPDIIVIANETHLHLDSLTKIKESGHTGICLVEKPIFASIPKIDPITNCFVAYNLRFLPALQELKRLTQTETILSVNVYCGQYLPNWRPNTDYSKSYSASPKTGGGVLNDLSHEIDYLLWLIGKPEKLVSLGGKISNLKITSEDAFSVIFSTERSPINVLSINYLDRITQRSISIITNENTYKLDFISGELSKNSDVINSTCNISETYILQAKSIIENDFKDLCTFSEGIDVLKMISLIKTNTI